MNEGEIDYRKSSFDSDSTPSSSELELKYGSAPAEDDLDILDGDNISVHLLSAFLKGFNETKWPGGIGRGEIAIVANINELKDGGAIDFSPGAVRKSGRLVYYSEDVRRGGHFLDFSALPVYGPMRYHGGPLLIELHVLELDTVEDGNIRGLLRTLAAMGAAAYPPASPVLGVLDRLGEALLSGQSDDSEFRYHFVLSPPGGVARLRYPVLEAGNYVLVKQEPFAEASEQGRAFPPTPWGDLRFDENTGRVKTFANGSRGEETDFTEATCLVVQINRGLPGEFLEVTQSFQKFESAMLDAVEARNERMEAAVKRLARRLETEIRVSAARGAIQTLRRKTDAEDASARRSALSKIHELIHGELEGAAAAGSVDDAVLQSLMRDLRRVTKLPSLGEDAFRLPFAKFMRQYFPELRPPVESALKTTVRMENRATSAKREFERDV